MPTDPRVVKIRPQPRQEAFLSSSCTITIYGGAAGGGKTWSLLLEPMRHLDNPHFGAVIFRRTLPEILNEGALWDESFSFYPLAGAVPNANRHQHVFPSGMTVTMASLQYEKNLIAWRGSQIPLLLFDQLETFTRKQFFYMLSRNRSKSGVAPYIRATCNPEPGWLADFLSWWIAPDGYADLTRTGKVRWMIRSKGDEVIWANTREELLAEYPRSRPLSVTFIVSTIYDNQALMLQDPEYLTKLEAMDFIDRERLLGDPVRGGNWKIKPAAGNLINRNWIEVVHPKEVPEGGKEVRYWDLAATLKKLKKKDPDYTSSVRMKKVGAIYYVMHCTNERLSPSQSDQRMKDLAILDGPGVKQKWEQEGGASGKRDAYHIATMLDGHDAQSELPQGDKITRGKGLCAQALAGNVKVVKGSWSEEWLNHMHNQPDWPHDDIWDASTGAYRELSGTIKKARGYQG